MARIVKSMAVVDRREPDAEAARSQLEARLVSRRVLKGGVLDGFGITFADPRAPVNRDSLLDEINKLTVQIEEQRDALAEAKKEIKRELAEAEKQYQRITEEIEKKKEEYRQQEQEYENQKAQRDKSIDADILQDEVYRQRVAHIAELQENARTQMAEMSRQLELDAKEAYDKAKTGGYNDGYNEGQTAAQNSFIEAAQPKLEELAELITYITDYGPNLFKQREDEFVQLALAIAEKVLSKELKTKPDTIVGMVNEFIQRNQRETYINISISPDLLPVRAKACDELMEQLKGLNGSVAVFVEKDAPEGTLVLETPKGVTDMSIPNQLNNIRESMDQVEPEPMPG